MIIETSKIENANVTLCERHNRLGSNLRFSCLLEISGQKTEHIDRFVGLTDFHCQQMALVSLLNLVALLPLIVDGQELLSQVNVCGLDIARWFII